MFVFTPFVIFTLTAVGRVVSETYKKGDKAVLSPGSVSDPITSIAWKHGADMAVEWYGEETTKYRNFKGRCEVNTNTGALTITNLSLNDSGRYTAEINNVVMKTTEIKVITAVPKPTIKKQCNPEVTQCTLTCDASITADMGTVTYSWKTGDRQIPDASNSHLNITKDDTESVGKPISCQLENPVSSERSDDIMSPFTNGTSVAVIIAAAVIALIVLVPLIALADYLIWCRKKHENAGCRQYLASFKRRRWLNCGRTAGTAGGGAQEYTLAPEQRNGVGTQQGRGEETKALVHVQNGVATFSVDNETHNQDQNLGSPEARNETQTLSGVPETAAQDLTPVELPEEPTSEPEVPKTTSEVQEELEGDQTPPRVCSETGARAGGGDNIGPKLRTKDFFMLCDSL